MEIIGEILHLFVMPALSYRHLVARWSRMTQDGGADCGCCVVDRGLSQCEAQWMDWLWPTLFAGGLFYSAEQQQKGHCHPESHRLYIMRILQRSKPSSSQPYCCWLL